MTRLLEKWKMLTVHQKNTRISFVFFIMFVISFMVSQMGVEDSIIFIAVFFVMISIAYSVGKLWDRVKQWYKR